MAFPIIPLFVLALPIIEIAVFILVGSEIGVLSTLGLIFLTTMIGAVLLRIQGLDLLQRISEETRAGRAPGRELIHGAMIVVAGALLLLPGFVTDAIGLLLFIPAVRDIGWRMIKNRITIVASSMEGRMYRAGRTPGRDGRDERGQGAPRVIDLEEGDFSREPDPDSPWNSGRDGDGGGSDRP